MAAVFQVRKPCPTCGRPVTTVPGDAAAGSQRYVCADCDGDPMRSPSVRAWIESPLKPPADPK